MRISKRVLLTLLLSAGALYGADDDLTLKQGGVCFRGDDNQTPEEWEQLAVVFERHGYRMCAALNFLRGADDPEYLRFVRGLQRRGHEVMDHSPNHRVCSLTLPHAGEAQAYVGKAGVDHVTGNTVCFRYRLPDPPRYAGQGRAMVSKNVVRPSDPASLAGWSGAPFVRVAGSENVYRISRLDDGTARLQTFWYEDTVDLGGPREVVLQWIAKPDVFVVPEGLVYQTEKVREFCRMHRIVPPKTWIQPGGSEPTLWREHAAAVFGEQFGYVAAATYPDKSLKCFGEYDPRGDKRFGMQWGDFFEDKRDLAWNKHRIAEGVARHYVMIGHSHLSGPAELGGWPGVLDRTERLLVWCKKTGIPVRTYSQWARILYDLRQDPSVNIFPRLDVDRDENGQPDGISLGPDAVLLTEGGPEGAAAALELDQDGTVCGVSRLGGLEKGRNVFSCRLRGDVGQTVGVEFRFPELLQSAYVSFTVQTTGWHRFTRPVVVPEEASVVDILITATRTNGRAMRIAGLSLAAQP